MPKDDVQYIVDVDLEDNEILDFFWDDDEDPPPIVKGKVRKEGKEKNEEKKN